MYVSVLCLLTSRSFRCLQFVNILVVFLSVGYSLLIVAFKSSVFLVAHIHVFNTSAFPGHSVFAYLLVVSVLIPLPSTAAISEAADSSIPSATRWQGAAEAQQASIKQDKRGLYVDHIGNVCSYCQKRHKEVLQCLLKLMNL